MANVTGPTSALPGSVHTPPMGQICDDHPNRLAVKRVTGEVDSFGSEQSDMCQTCYDSYNAALKTQDTSGTCDWCKGLAPALFPKRDWEEGSAGRVYNVCQPCIQRQKEALNAELSDDWNR